MPRYYFHTRIGDDLLADEEGAELRDPDQAWRVAQATIRSSLSEGEDRARLLTASLLVTDEAGETVLEFPFAEAALAPPDDGERLN